MNRYPPVMRRRGHPSPPRRVKSAPRSRTRSPSRLFFVIVLVGGLAAVILSILALLGFYGYYQFTARIVPGVRVGNTNLGGLTVKEAAIELQKSWNLENTIQITNGQVSVGILPEELGLGINALQTAQRAYAVAHDEIMPAEMMQMIVSLNEGWSINPVVFLDEDIAQISLTALSPQLSKEPNNATLKVEGAQVIPVPGEFGYTVNMDASMETLTIDPQAVLDAGYLKVTLMPVLPPVMDATGAAAEAQTLIEKAVTLHAYDPISDQSFQWTIDENTLASWLSIEAAESGPRATYDVDKVALYLNSLGTDMGEGRYLDGEKYSSQLVTELRSGELPLVFVSHKPSTYIVQPGDTLLKIGWKLGMPFWMIMHANPDIDPDALWVGAELLVPSKDDLLPLPIVPGKRIVISIGKQHMWVYENGARINDFKISTGIDRSPTQPGVFQVQSHKKNAYASVWDLHMPHFLGVYEAWPGFMNGIHGLPTLSSGRQLWANILGSPASYGCIILNTEPAKWLYSWAEDGVVVEITP